MKKNVLALSFLITCGLAYPQLVPQWQWDTTLSLSATGRLPEAHLWKGDGGNFYVVENGVYLKKYTGDKNFLWGVLFTAGFINGVAYNGDGGAYVTGTFQQTLTAGSFQLQSRGGSDIFIARIDRFGTITWINQLGGGMPDAAGGICVDGNDVYITGKLADSAYFDNTLVFEGQGRNVFVAKLGIQGDMTDMTYSELRGKADEDYASGAELQMGANGKLYLLARIEGTYKWQDTLFDEYFSDLVIRFDRDLKLEWKKRIGMYYYGWDFDLRIDSKGNIIYVQEQYTNHQPASGKVIKLSPEGKTLWDEPIHWYNTVAGLDLDEADNLYYSRIGCRFAPGEFGEYVPAMAYIFTCMKYPNGDTAWIRIDSSRYVGVTDVLITHENQFLLSGYLEDTLKLKHLLHPPENIFMASFNNPVYVGLPEISALSSSSLMVQPVPSSGTFVVTGVTLPSRLFVYDMNGQCVHKDENFGGDGLLDLSDKEDGVYIVKISNAETTQCGRIIKSQL
jgi:hypothetical protein